jgi:cobalt/nickel transport protein
MSSGRRISTRTLLVTGVLVALVLAGFVSFYASSDPDGLEYVAGQQGFAEDTREHPSANSPLADYTTRGVEEDRASGALAGITGTLLVLVLTGGSAWLLRRRRPADAGNA